ncbi:hypothetical protein ABT160_16115 [Streptomyces sp. NPDC001941]|uniref:hypothetical protein n=1 Tax=Streptomyces sp. NPDC001941 TaxID=3154659 RepID=UPI003327AEBE
MERKKKTWFAVGAAVLAFGGILSACDGDKATSTDAKPKPTTEAAKPAAKPSEAPPKAPAANDVPSPDAGQTAALVRALTAVDPGLTAKEDRAVRRAENVCSDIKAKKDPATVQKNAKLRYEGGTVPSLSDKQAADIVTAVKSSFCS